MEHKGGMQMIELKPCPFCGGKARFLNWKSAWAVECCNDYCCVLPETEICDTKEAAVEIWNRRVGDTDGKERTE